MSVLVPSGDEDALVCALLHDVVEDGGVDLDEIRQEFGDAAGDAVGLLTHEEGVPYLDYVRHIAESGSAAAIRCKISDLVQNLDIARLPEAGQKDFERVEKKYLPALRILLDRLEKGVADAADE